MRNRVKLHHSPTQGWHVDLPSYAMIPNSWLPVVPGKSTPDGVLPTLPANDPIHRILTCEVDIPDAYANDAATAIDLARLRALHRGHPRWADPAQPPDL